MRILIDIYHPADVNFYKNTVRFLKDEHDLTIFVRKRGNLDKLAEQEFDVPVRIVGRHFSGKWGKLFGLIHRVICLMVLNLRYSFDVVTSFGGFYSAIAAKFTWTKSVIFYDDYEYKIAFNICRWFASVFVIPSCLNVKGKNVRTFNGYKELAYLQDFVPSKKILTNFDVKPQEYIFVRHVARISLQYKHSKHEDALEAIVAYLKGKNLKIIASIEDQASSLSCFSNSSDIQFVKAPVKDFHSLIFYARCVISSGDTIARESALLQVPTLYIGKREMKIHNELLELGFLYSPIESKQLFTLEKILEGRNPRRMNMELWDDTTQVIISNLI